MQLKPNETFLEGVVTDIRAVEGRAAVLVFDVQKTIATDIASDFVGALPGETVQLYAADAQIYTVGGRYKISAALVGGPNHELLIARTGNKLGSGF